MNNYFLTWTLGGYPSPSLEIASRFCESFSLDDWYKEKFGSNAEAMHRAISTLCVSAHMEINQYAKKLRETNPDFVVALGNEVHEKLGIYFMRRLKKDVAKDLPNKIEQKHQTLMPSVQEMTYKKVVNAYTSGIQPNMLVTIMEMREVSEHPYLYDKTLPTRETIELIETSARLQATKGFLEKIRARNEKVIIFAERKDIQKMLQRVCLGEYGIVAKII